jgi:hypothetical protein
MAAHPVIVQSDTPVVWDGNLTLVKRGTMVDIPPGSALEEAYGGPGNLEPIDQGRVYS